MGVTDRYRSASDLPKILPVFPLRGAILLPRASLTLNVFEPRYLALVDTALASDRLMGVVQPSPDAGLAESPIGKEFPLRRIGCAGRIVGFTENDDGRMGISLAGIASRNGILLIAHYLHLVRHEGESFTPEMIERAGLPVD